LLDCRERTGIGADVRAARAPSRGTPAAPRDAGGNRRCVRLAAQRIARLDQGEQIAGQRALTRRRAQHGGCQARRRAGGEDRAAEFGQAAVAIGRAELGQQFARAGQRAGRRRIEPAQVGRAPRVEIERQCGQFHLCNFRAPRGFESLACGHNR
jgi:hypothetical protein